MAEYPHSWEGKTGIETGIVWACLAGSGLMGMGVLLMAKQSHTL